MMKKAYILVFVFLFCLNDLQAQSATNSIREIARKHMIENEELSPDADVDGSYHTLKDPVSGREFQPLSVLAVYDVVNDLHVSDPIVSFPNNDTLSYYRISAISPHTYVHLIFAKDGKWIIVNMRKGFRNVMDQGFKICDALNLDAADSYYVIKEIITYYERNYRNHGGAVTEDGLKFDRRIKSYYTD